VPISILLKLCMSYRF